MSKIKDRLKEPSTFAGIGAVLAGLGLFFKDDNLPVIADAVQTGGETYLSSGNATTAIGAFFMGLLAIFMPEQKK